MDCVVDQWQVMQELLEEIVNDVHQMCQRDSERPGSSQGNHVIRICSVALVLVKFQKHKMSGCTIRFIKHFILVVCRENPDKCVSAYVYLLLFVLAQIVSPSIQFSIDIDTPLHACLINTIHGQPRSL